MYHVELKHGRFQSARVFNIDEPELEPSLLAPWRAGGSVMIEGKKWDLRDAEVTILQGPALEPEELAYGHGWSAAQKRATDVSGELLKRTPPPAAPVAALGGAAQRSVVVMHGGGEEETRRALFAQLGELGAAPLDWTLLLQGARDAGGGPSDALDQALSIAGALIVLLGASDPPDLLVWAGMAVGRRPGAVGFVLGPGASMAEALSGPSVNAGEPLGELLRAVGVNT
jgi:hypothetical protein